MDIVAPLVKTGVISEAANLWLAVPIGFLFGFGIYHGGFTDSRIVGSAFYLRNVRVPIVMTAAIAAGALGLWGLGLTGFLDLSQVYFLPTYVAPVAVGGFLFGIGMALGGFCPGTAIASVAVGKIDAMVFVVGFFGGSLLFGDLYPLWREFYESDYGRDWRIDHLLGIGIGTAVLLTVIAAVAISLLMRLGQRRFWRTTDEECEGCLRSEQRMKYQAPLVVLGLVIGIAIAFLPSDAFIKGAGEEPYFIVPKSPASAPQAAAVPVPATPTAPGEGP